MEIIKTIINDKKEKHNSFELRIIIPVMPTPQSLRQIGGFSSCDEVEYTSHHSSIEEADIIFDEFLVDLSTYHNKHQSLFKVKNS